MMVRVKRGLTDPTGEKQAKRENRTPVKETPSTVVQTVAESSSRVNQTPQTFHSPVSSAKSAESFEKAVHLASSMNVPQFDLSGAATNLYDANSSNIPLMKASEANKQKLIAQQKINSLEVVESNLKLNRTALRVGKESVLLIGDVVDYNTAKIDVSTKVVDNQISETNYQSRQSKLIQTEEFRNQQLIATQGTVSLTEGIRQEWQLKFERQQTRNDALRLEIEGAKKTLEQKRLEIEAQILDL